MSSAIPRGSYPADWSEDRLIDSATRVMDFRGRTPRKLGMDWGGGTIPALSARNVRMGMVDLSEECYFGSEELYRRWMTHGDMQEGDTLITTEAPLGNVAHVPDGRKYILSQRVVLFRPDPSRYDSAYFAKALQSPAFQRQLLENATGSTALGIKRKKLEQLTLYRPPLPEQRRIAAALSDADDLITRLERLIAKKEAIKQGMMQQLLTGKTRLPGFSDPWTLRRLSDALDYQQPGPYSVRTSQRGHREAGFQFSLRVRHSFLGTPTRPTASTPRIRRSSSMTSRPLRSMWTSTSRRSHRL